MRYDWLSLAKQLQSIAQAGLTFSQDKYDLDRYEQLMGLSKKILADFSDLDMAKLNGIFNLEQGYLTPKVDVRAVILRQGKILMVKETIDNRWALPGGWADVNLTASEVVVKEVAEEAGLEVNAKKLLAVLDKKCHPHPPELYHVYKMFFLCEETGGEIKIGMETSAVDFFDVQNLPELSVDRNTQSQIEMVCRLAKDPGSQTVFD